MNLRTWMVISIFALSIASCRTMELANKTIQINKGDDKAKVLQVMGTPQDRQFLGDYEVLQYCITGAGFGYHDYSAIWLRSGQVVGITTYKDHTPASSCRGHFVVSGLRTPQPPACRLIQCTVSVTTVLDLQVVNAWM